MALSFLKLKKKKDDTPSLPPLEIVRAEAWAGLSKPQVEERVRLGYVNTPVDPPGKTVKQFPCN